MMAQDGIRGGKVCECACGTGNLTLPLSRLGFSMTGVDLSQDMLWIASQKARKAGIGIPFVQQDMRRLRLHRPMDAVLATCDGVNYLLSDDDALLFFQAAYQALRPGGGLYFDVSTPCKLKETLGNRVICEDTERVTYIWQNTYSEKKNQVEMRLCFFVRQPDGSYRRIDEEQVQKAHTEETLVRLLLQAGFAKVRVFGNSNLERPKENEQRWHFAALRPVQTDESMEEKQDEQA